MRTLVTGASGFSGSIVAQTLARAGFEVVGVYRRDTRFLAALIGHARIRLIRADIVDAGTFPGPFDAVVHAAATPPGPDVSVARMVHDNVAATFALIDAAVRWKCRCFVFFSSMSHYGEVVQPVIDENTPVHNPDIFGMTKILAERRLAELSGQLPGLALRLPGILGPGAHRNWLSGVAARLCRGEAIRAFHLDRPFNNAAHIDDVVALILAVLQSGWDGFDAVVMGARGMTTVRAAIQRLARGLDVPFRIEPVAPAKASFVLSCERAMAEYGYDPMSIDDIIDRYALDVLEASGGPLVAPLTLREG